MRLVHAALFFGSVSACQPFAAGEDRTDAAADAGATPPASCKALLAASPDKKGRDDVYEIDPDGAGGAPPIRVYCDLTTDGGGWTVVGRSGPLAGGVVGFGWRSATGSVTDPQKPYSVDVASAKLTFDEVLVADRDAQALGPRTRAYKFAVTRDFLEVHADDTIDTAGVATVLGDCAPSGGPTMLQYAGATSDTSGFFLRDVGGLDQRRGLKPTGFDLAYQDCTRGGLLDGTPGVILVR